MATNTSEIIRKHRLTVDDYHRMGEAGILHARDRVELIEGEVVDMSPIGSRHAGTVNYLNKVLNAALGGNAIISAQSPIVLGDSNEPEPDILVLKPRDDYYRRAHPTAADALLIIEAADTSLRYDRDIKIPLYAQFFIPEVWLVDLENERMTVYSSPENNQYRKIEKVSQYSRVLIKGLPDSVVNLSELFAK